MELITANISTPPTVKLPYGKIVLAPISDLQYGAQGCDLDLFKRYVKRAMEKKAYFIGLGDFVDMPSPSGRSKIKSAGFYDTVEDALEAQAMEAIETVWNILKPTKGRWLGWLKGHHFYEFRGGATSDTILAERLEAPFMGTCGIVNVNQTRPTRTVACQIFAHHGLGSGKTVVAPLNKMLPMVPHFPTVDIFLIAHFHSVIGTKVATKIPVYPKSQNKSARMKNQIKLVTCTGGYLDGYSVGSQIGGKPEGSYVEQGLMPPRALGGVFIEITPVRNYADGDDLVSLDIQVTY